MYRFSSPLSWGGLEVRIRALEVGDLPLGYNSTHVACRGLARLAKRLTRPSKAAFAAAQFSARASTPTSTRRARFSTKCPASSCAGLVTFEEGRYILEVQIMNSDASTMGLLRR